jgi:class 3 adenylate cyclase
MQRRLAAILAADVVGYSRLMGADEIGTLNSLKSHRRELVDCGISEHHGRIVKTTGDGMLVEFASVVDAVACAVKVQRSMVGRNADVPAERQIVFRIGINVGDIIIDGDDIFGDGVNIAARLETLCEPGGLCISRAANDQIRDKLGVRRSWGAGGKEHRAGGRRVRADRQGHRGDSGRRDPVVGGRRGGGVGRPVRAGNPLLLDRRRRAAGLCPDGPGSSASQNRPLDDPHRVRIRKPGSASFLPGTVPA